MLFDMCSELPTLLQQFRFEPAATCMLGPIRRPDKVELEVMNRKLRQDLGCICSGDQRDRHPQGFAPTGEQYEELVVENRLLQHLVRVARDAETGFLNSIICTQTDHETMLLRQEITTLNSALAHRDLIEEALYAVAKNG